MNWIKIKDQLPKKGELVLIYKEKKYPTYYVWLVDEVDISNTSYTHWMPLPQPPEDELKCPLCKVEVELRQCSIVYDEHHPGTFWDFIRCFDCGIRMHRLTTNYEYVEAQEDLINRWKSLGKVR